MSRILGMQVTPAASEYGGTEREQTFIQQKSLALLPLLCRFPSFTPSASEKIVKLIVLVSKRLNPKELWLGLDSVVETSRVGLEALADGDGIGPDYEDEDEEGQDMEGNEDLVTDGTVQDSPEHISVYLSRGLLAMQIRKPIASLYAELKADIFFQLRYTSPSPHPCQETRKVSEASTGCTHGLPILATKPRSQKSNRLAGGLQRNAFASHSYESYTRRLVMGRWQTCRIKSLVEAGKLHNGSHWVIAV